MKGQVSHQLLEVVGLSLADRLHNHEKFDMEAYQKKQGSPAISRLPDH